MNTKQSPQLDLLPNLKLMFNRSERLEEIEGAGLVPHASASDVKRGMGNPVRPPLRGLNKSQPAILERNSKWFWVCVICGFFSLDFSIAAIAISMAAGDPSFRSIPGYGERAVAWDVRQKRKEISSKLGWKIEVQPVEPFRDAIEVHLYDDSNQPIAGCTGSLRLFHFTRVAEQFVCDLVEMEPGRYRAKVDVAKLGRWQLEMEIHADGDRKFWVERTLDWFDVSNKGMDKVE